MYTYLLVSSEIINSMLSDSSPSPQHEPSTRFQGKWWVLAGGGSEGKLKLLSLKTK